MTEVQPYFVEKARAVMSQAGGQADDVTELAAWAQDARRIGDQRRGVLIDAGGRLVADTVHHPETPSSPGVTYVTAARIPEADQVVGKEAGMACAVIQRATGRPVIQVSMSDVAVGGGGWVRDPDPDPPMSGGELHLARVAMGVTLPELAGILRVSERTVRRWESGVSPIPRGIASEVMALERRVDALAEDLAAQWKERGGTPMTLPQVDGLPVSVVQVAGWRAYRDHGVRWSDTRGGAQLDKILTSG